MRGVQAVCFSVFNECEGWIIKKIEQENIETQT